MLSFVSLPISDAGGLTVILGRRAALRVRFSSESLMPGKMIPPKYSFFLDIISNVTAVPKSITIEGYP